MMSLSTLSDDFDWHGFYEFAEGICERDAKDEIQCRVAIGRLYYSAFNIVREYARDRYGFWSDSNVHSSLIEFFAKNGYDEYDSIRFPGISDTSETIASIAITRRYVLGTPKAF